MRRFSPSKKKRRNASYMKERKIRVLKSGRKTVPHVRVVLEKSVKLILNPQLLPLTPRSNPKLTCQRQLASPSP
jgi:hypothetical protein